MVTFKHGITVEASATDFRVWAPLADTVDAVLCDRPDSPYPMRQVERGYYEGKIENCPTGTRYLYQVNGNEPRPDPASLSQPEGVHKPSEVIDTAYPWTDDTWRGLALDEYIIYEVHIGTLTTAGTFEAAIAELPRLKGLGITAIEIMPLSSFPGERNWGYDGVYPYAVQHSYGGLRGLQSFVDAAHSHGLAVIIDVVYNHLGPEGNYLSTFGPYFTESHRTPWGASLNFDEHYSDGVRDYFIGNALFWIDDCHVDALRLDAVHAIVDQSASPFLRELTKEVHARARQLHRRAYVMFENDRNDPAGATPPELGGLGADSQWSDDFHHALHSVLTGEKHGYYSEFGEVSQLAKAFTKGYVFDGIHSAGRARYHGADSSHLNGEKFVVCSQNHDQIGNRPAGERLSALLSPGALRLAATATLLSPYIPLLLMGEEFACEAPFLYFVSHSDEVLVAGVRAGRAGEFREFFAQGEAPDPQAEETLQRSKLIPNDSPRGKQTLALYRDLITLRKSVKAFHPGNKRQSSAQANDRRRTLVVTRPTELDEAVMIFSFGEAQNIIVPTPHKSWQVLLDTEDPRYGGAGKQTAPYLQADGELEVSVAASSAIILISTPAEGARP